MLTHRPSHQRRGAVLLCFGIAWLLYGIGVETTPLPPGAIPGFIVFSNFISLRAAGWIWVVGGAAGVVFSFLRRRREALVFPLVQFPPLVWCLGSLADLIAGKYPRGWVTASIYAAFVAALTIIAGWPDEHRRPPE